MHPRIKKLPDELVKRIAAGEILVRPVNAVKELIENALDAQATHITVHAHDGGLRGLSVSDDGCGIYKDDLALLCERHATSKLYCAEDLLRMHTFGFRGEALASVSVAGRVSVLTKTAQDGDGCGWRANYSNNKLIGLVEPAACTFGTTITVEDLFCAFPDRRRVFLEKAGEEHSRIFELICRYAIANAGKVGFMLKKNNKPIPDLVTTKTMDSMQVIAAIFGAELVQNVCQLHDNAVLSVGDGQSVNLSIDLIHTTAYYRRKEPVIIIFINERLVEWPLLNKSIRSLYSQIILSGWHPWVFVKIAIPTDRVDVNVSPTKNHVTLADSEEACDLVTKVLEKSLKEGAQVKQMPPSLIQMSPSAPIDSSPSGRVTKAAPYKRNYSDHRATKIDQFLSSPHSGDPSLTVVNVLSSPLKKYASSDANFELKSEEGDHHVDQSRSENHCNQATGQIFDATTLASHSQPSISSVEQHSVVDLAPWDLTSVRILRSELKASKSEEVSRVIRRHVMVGCGCRGEKTFIQYETCLLVLNTRPFAVEYFYSVLVNDIGRLARADLIEPVKIDHAISECISNELIKLDEKVDNYKMIQEIIELLIGKSALFADYFSLVFSNDAYLISVPWLIDEKAIPRKDLVGLLLFRLAVEVEWEKETEEKEIIGCICREIAMIYSHLPFKDDSQLNDSFIKGRLFPAFKQSLHGFPSSLARQGHIQVVTDVHSLYKRFDRC